MSTGQDIIDEVRDLLQDTTDESFSDAVILRYINRGAKEFCATTGCLQDTATIDTDSATYIFTLSSSCTNPFLIINVQFNGTPLTKTFLHEVTYKFGASSGTPDQSTNWYEFGGKLYISIKAITATGSSALTVFYVRTPTDLSAVGDTFDFPDEWDSAIIAYAVAHCRYTDRDTILQSSEMSKYEAMRQNVFLINKNKIMGDSN